MGSIATGVPRPRGAPRQRAIHAPAPAIMDRKAAPPLAHAPVKTAPTKPSDIQAPARHIVPPTVPPLPKASSLAPVDASVRSPLTNRSPAVANIGGQTVDDQPLAMHKSPLSSQTRVVPQTPLGEPRQSSASKTLATPETPAALISPLPSSSATRQRQTPVADVSFIGISTTNQVSPSGMLLSVTSCSNL
jgi:hypothetical protein